MAIGYRILYLEDQEETVGRVAELMKRDYLPCDLTWVKDREAFHNALLGGWSYDLLFMTDALADLPCATALSLVKELCPELPVFLLVGAMDEEAAAAWLTQGATEVIPRARPARLAPAVRRALRESRERAALRGAEGLNTRLTSLLRTILEATSDGILVTDLAGSITTYNRKFMALCGIPEYVMAPMKLERVLAFLQDQFDDPQAFLREAQALAEGRGERRPLGILNATGERTIAAYGQPEHSGGQTVGKVFSFMDLTDREGTAEPSPQAPPIPRGLLEAARSGRLVPWLLTNDELIISEKGEKLLGLPPGGLPRDLSGLEALIHPDDLDTFRLGLETAQKAPFVLRLRRTDGVWIRTQWNLKKGNTGYRGIFTEIAGRE